MPQHILNIPSGELPIAAILLLAILGLTFLSFKIKFLVAKGFTKQIGTVLDNKKMGDLFEKAEIPSQKRRYFISAISLLISIGLAAVWYYLQIFTSLIVFSLCFLLATIISYSNATMSKSQLKKFRELKKNQTIIIVRIFVIGFVMAYALNYFVPTEYLNITKMINIYSYVLLGLIAIGVLDHFYSKTKLK
tara:strand:- start:342 stop:914 length:573 start_codon:yes stop_codon:yes gene_type:complete